MNSNTLPTYAPPILQDVKLKKELLLWYPSHSDTQSLLADLVEEYKRFWRLILSYPHRRVVAPGPVMAVQRVHQAIDEDRYFDDCMNYFERFMPRNELAWGGLSDHMGTHDTVMVYEDLFRTEPPRAWADMARIVGPKRIRSV